jgi:hypothetical protein
MEINWLAIIYTLFLVNSMGAIIVAWFGSKWWIYSVGTFANWFPPAKGWSVLYLVLVLAIGYLLGFIA